ncbi:hypothetical protein P153DRAFT_389668 [Dothidotthia symphoricarpi CBS 119687]|uniref:Uncharacterized protein n=1 Tax=Dothidotthia symphoricarpi CBS 119687 TaxID=1392245 RepID=A0A6A6A3N4_9PLEO|nr:uncharacterized protein P153DRAFT_389668 [Dothidotthia symphoricarpi CBS 119687]KAF2125517.1 hypothetical protein P153DRAFT_389668 [Dothidotthia symphoricarpi CBS 119687]
MAITKSAMNGFTSCNLVCPHNVQAATNSIIYTTSAVPQERSRDDPPSPPPQPPPSPVGWNRSISLDFLAPLEI